jgi:rare lipoprotein A
MVHRSETNMCVIVKVNDRMHPKHQSRVIDLSHSAAKYLDMVREGVVKVTIVPLPNDATTSSTMNCAMGFEVEEVCTDCQASPLQFQETTQ